MSIEQLVTSRAAQKQLKKLPLHIHNRVIQALRYIKADPRSGVRLRGELEGYLKYRVGDYRVVYSIDVNSKTVIVYRIEHRQGVYK